MQFLNRRIELTYLDERYARNRAEIAILYGRRRVGKSALLYHWSADKPRCFFWARRESEVEALARFASELHAAQGNSAQSIPQFANWAAAFDYLAKWTQTQRTVVVIDEFPYLVEASPGIATILQEAWDRRLQHSQLYLALTGSVMGVMLRETIDATAPLYKRHTWPFQLKPLRIYDLPEFFPKRTPIELVETFAILGGMPFNLTNLDRDATLQQNIRQEILTPAGSLFAEPLVQLHEEIGSGDPIIFMRILTAIAQGFHRRADIAARAALPDPHRVDHYLATLTESGLIERREPLDRRVGGRSWGMYHLLDPFYRFWHRWVLPKREVLEIGHGVESTLDELRYEWSHFIAPTWEELARTHLFVASGRAFPFFISEVGSWWNAHAQIDVVGVNRNERRVILGEAKWLNTPMTSQQLDALIDRGRLWLDGESGWDTHYALFSRSGFNQSLVDVAEYDPKVHLFTPENMFESTKKSQ
jgi:AAA+ ATPase superfamily predicted ATPase